MDAERCCKIFLCGDGFWHVNEDNNPGVRDCRGVEYNSIAEAVRRSCELAAFADVPGPQRFRGPHDVAAIAMAKEWGVEYESE